MRVKDIEDEDCFYEGVVTEIDGDNIKYIVKRIVWNGEEDLESEEIGKEINTKWSIIEFYED